MDHPASISLDYSPLDRQAAALGCEIARYKPLAPHTTFKIGGPADRLVTVGSEEQLSGILSVLGEWGLPMLILGRGSDLLVRDKGFRGAVIRLGGAFESASLLEDGVTLRAGAGMSLAAACMFLRDMGLCGMEFAWGIPGSIGGAVYMNAGAYGGEMKDVVARVRHMDIDGTPGEYGGEDLGFGYRRSAYAGSGKVITWAHIRAAHGSKEEIAARMNELMTRRKEKQPYDSPSAGSTFKRPKTGYAAALIEECGLKGRRVGGAQVSEKHSGFIINTGGASCQDVLALMEIVQETVLRQTGIELEPEVRVVGEA